jgi:hypothetical protein
MDWQSQRLPDDHMSLEHLCTCRAARVHARRASDHQLSLASLAVFAVDGQDENRERLCPAAQVQEQFVGEFAHELHLLLNWVMLADGGAPAVLASVPHSVMLADGGAPAVLGLSPALPERTYAAPPQSTHLILSL